MENQKKEYLKNLKYSEKSYLKKEEEEEENENDENEFEEEEEEESNIEKKQIPKDYLIKENENRTIFGELKCYNKNLTTGEFKYCISSTWQIYAFITPMFILITIYFFIIYQNL